jgi:hypothetical protein
VVYFSSRFSKWFSRIHLTCTHHLSHRRSGLLFLQCTLLNIRNLCVYYSFKWQCRYIHHVNR